MEYFAMGGQEPINDATKWLEEEMFGNSSAHKLDNCWESKKEIQAIMYFTKINK